MSPPVTPKPKVKAKHKLKPTESTASNTNTKKNDVENGEISPTRRASKHRVSTSPPVTPKVKAKHKPRESTASNSNKKKNSNKKMSYDTALEEAKKMKMAELKKECQQRGIYTESFIEKSQFEESYAKSFSNK
jgi:hypothetical protein